MQFIKVSTIMVLLGFVSLSVHAETMTYAEFFRQVEQGQIKEVRIDSQYHEITGLKQNGEAFVTKQNVADPYLLQTLLKNNVRVLPVKQEESGAWFGSVFLVFSLLLPLLIWITPLVLIARSDKVQGKEKLAWIFACLFISWLSWVMFYLLAPLKQNDR